METQETVRCAYCGQQRPVNEMEKGMILYRGRNSLGQAAVLRKKDWYCKDTYCRARDQMAHEG